MKVRESSGVVRDMTAEEIDATSAEYARILAVAARANTFAALKDIDLRTIRRMREHLAPNDVHIKALDDEAAAERAKLPAEDRG